MINATPACFQKITGLNLSALGRMNTNATV